MVRLGHAVAELVAGMRPSATVGQARLRGRRASSGRWGSGDADRPIRAYQGGAQAPSARVFAALLAGTALRGRYAVFPRDHADMGRAEGRQLDDLSRGHARPQRPDDGIDHHLPGVLKDLISLPVLHGRLAEQLPRITHRYTVAPSLSGRRAARRTTRDARKALDYSAIT